MFPTMLSYTWRYNRFMGVCDILTSQLGNEVPKKKNQLWKKNLSMHKGSWDPFYYTSSCKSVEVWVCLAPGVMLVYSSLQGITQIFSHIGVLTWLGHLFVPDLFRRLHFLHCAACWCHSLLSGFRRSWTFYNNCINNVTHSPNMKQLTKSLR